METIEEIEREYSRLGHQLGWRFLYSPASTLSIDSRMLFVGDNPGGSTFVPPIRSVEEGNAYRVELWPGGRSGGPNPLQKQVCGLFKILSRKLDSQIQWHELMDQTLTSNFCPFRSPSWPPEHKEESMAFSYRLWSRIFDNICPSVLICMSRDLSFKYFGRLLLAKGLVETERTQELPVEWGNYTYSQATYKLGDREVLMIRLPHLSRFKIFGRAKSQRAVEQLTDTIVEAV